MEGMEQVLASQEANLHYNCTMMMLKTKIVHKSKRLFGPFICLVLPISLMLIQKKITTFKYSQGFIKEHSMNVSNGLIIEG